MDTIQSVMLLECYLHGILYFWVVANVLCTLKSSEDYIFLKLRFLNSVEVEPV